MLPLEPRQRKGAASFSRFQQVSARFPGAILDSDE
jgi:hypothetical protein